MPQLKVRRSLLSLAIASAFGIAAAPAYAQDNTQDRSKAEEQKPVKAVQSAKAEAEKETIAEIVVSATRQSTSLLKTPVAVTAITQESLTRSGVTDVRGLSGNVPNLQISTGADSGVQLSIRGVSSNNFTEIGDPAVGLHVGGLYSPRPQGAMALMFDLDQVEVLRGPQGTLFGRNSTAGSVNIIPAKPEFGSTYGSTELDFGKYNQRQMNVIQNFGISDNFAMRATFMKVTRDGWINQMQDFTDVDAPANGFHADGIPDVDQRYNRKVDKKNFYNNKNEWAGRLSGRWKVTKDFEWNFAYEKFQNSGAGDIALKDCAQAAGTRFACTGGPWDVQINVPGAIDMSIDTLRSGMVWSLNDNTKLEYNFAHAIQKRSQTSDDDGGYHPILSQITAHLPVGPDGDWNTWNVVDNTSRTLDSKYVSDVHEFQLKQNFKDLQYVAGAFWMHEKNQINYAQEMLVNAPYGFPISQYYNQPNRQIDAKALYAQTDWQFAPTWTATIGGRFSRDSKTDQGGKVFGGEWDTTSPAYYNGLYNPGTPGDPGFRPHSGADLTAGMGPLAGTGAYGQYQPPAQNDNSMSWKKFTYRFGLMKQVTPNDMVYTSLSTGYKSGGFGDKDDACGGKICVTGPSPQPTFFAYKPETVTNFELGYKGKMLDNRLSLSATFFYSQYKDMQVTGDNFSARVKHDGPCPADTPTCDIIVKWQTVNVGVVDIPGLELEFDYKPWKGARIGGFFSYIKSKMKDYPSFSDSWGCGVRAEFGAVPCPDVYSGDKRELAGRLIYDITGNHLPLAPKYTFGFNFSQNIVLDNDYVLVPWFAVKWQDKMYFTLRNLDNAHISDGQTAFAKVDASLKLIAPNNWHVEAYVLNMTNKMTKNSAGDAGGFIRATYNDPRMIGVRVGFEY
jgi:iron complex outermembrane receptor protein